MKQWALPSHGEAPAVIRSLQSAGCSLFASSLYSKNGVQRYWTANVPLGPVAVKPCSHDHFTCSPRRSMNADAASHDLLVATVAALQGQLRTDAAQQDRERLLTECAVAALRENCLVRLTSPGAWAATRRGTGILNTGSVLIGLFPNEVRHKVWARTRTPRQSVC